MPRGVKKEVNYTAELAEIDAKINRHKAQISTLEARRKEIVDLQQQADAKRLMEFLTKSGLSIADVIEKLSPTYKESA